MSAPAPFTVNTPPLHDMLPSAPTSPVSCVDHGVSRNPCVAPWLPMPTTWLYASVDNAEISCQPDSGGIVSFRSTIRCPSSRSYVNAWESPLAVCAVPTIQRPLVSHAVLLAPPSVPRSCMPRAL